jgi:UDP-3-O-[3-hydroxymyristoyl] glucosamine N-acyltransferase
MVVSLRDVACMVDGKLHGDGDIPITGADIIRDARRGDITFAESARMADRLTACPASAVLAPPDFEPQGIAFITVPNVHEAFTRIVAHFRPPQRDEFVGVHASAVVSPTAKLCPGVRVHANAVIGDGVIVGARSVIHSGVQIMAGCKIGEDVILFPNAVLYENTVVGSRTLIHANAVIGAYGFGYTTVRGRHRLSAQLGNVEIGDDVDIGACTTVDRGTYGATVIGEGTKIDNHVMIAHNCRIGRHNIICSQVGVAGSTTTGDYVVMAGQVGIRDHVQIGDGVTIGAKAGVMNDIPAGATYVGIPATPERQQMLIQAAIQKLPELKKQLKELQRTVTQLETAAGKLPHQEAA